MINKKYTKLLAIVLLHSQLISGLNSMPAAVLRKDTLIKPVVLKSSFVKNNDTIYSIEGKDTLCKYPYLESKLIKIKNTYFAIRFMEGEQFVIENVGRFKYRTPFFPAYEDFINIPKIWDVDSTNFWSINNVSLDYQQQGNMPICNPRGDLRKIPHQDLNMWTKERLVSDFFPRFDYYDISARLPLKHVIYDKYVLEQSKKKKKGLPYLDLYEEVENIKKNTFFDFLVTSTKGGIYFLYHDNELSLWQIDEEKKKSNAYCHWDKIQKLNVSLSGFRAFEHHKSIYVIDQDCAIYKIENNQLEKVLKLDHQLTDITILIDKDKDSILFVLRKDIKGDEPLKDIFEKRGIKIF